MTDGMGFKTFIWTHEERPCHCTPEHRPAVTLRTFFNEVFEGKIVDQNRHDLMIEHVWQGNLQIGIFDRFDVQIVPADSNLA